jgi:hypothetical protein
VVDAIKQAKDSFVSFTFFTKFLCGVNQILTVIAVIQIQNFRQAFMSKSRDLMTQKQHVTETLSLTDFSLSNVVKQAAHSKLRWDKNL